MKLNLLTKIRKIYIDYSVTFFFIILCLFGLMFYDYTIKQPKLNKELIELTIEYEKLNIHILDKIHYIKYKNFKNRQTNIILYEHELIKQLGIIDSIHN